MPEGKLSKATKARSRIITAQRLQEAWTASRDAKRRPGRPGSDRVTAQQFAQNLPRNIEQICSEIASGAYTFSKLRPVLVPKVSSESNRLICIPSVKDRLVQRAIVYYLQGRNNLKLDNSVSFAFLPDRGLLDALAAAINLRASSQWVVKADIQSFFDQIPRAYIKDLVRRKLRSNSVVPLIWKVIDCEISWSKDREAIALMGILPGRGLRQGMPLSPLLANLTLSGFDRSVIRRQIKMIRYADDILMFFDTKSEAERGLDFVIEELKNLQLTIPELSVGGKTEIIGPQQSFGFLGRELYFRSDINSYCVRITQKQINKIAGKLREEHSLTSKIKLKKDINNSLCDLSASLSAYRGIYNDVHNVAHLDCELRRIGREIASSYLLEIFGKEAVGNLTPAHQRFLGLDGLIVDLGDVSL
jgi:group II intron reverse transcriptase/maturase